MMKKSCMSIVHVVSYCASEYWTCEEQDLIETKKEGKIPSKDEETWKEFTHAIH